MNAGIAAYVILAQNTDVTDIVGVNIFPEVAEQETATPFIVYQLLSVAPEDTHDGPSTLDEVRFEFLCYADSYALAADLGSKVRGALDRVSGTYNGVNVESIQFNDVDIDTIDAPRRFAQVLTFTFRIKRDNVEIAQGTPVTGAKLGDLYDVDTTGVTDGQVIAYDAAAQEWQPADDAGGVTELGQLDDVTLNNTAQGEILKYNGNDWVNDTIDKSDVSLSNVDNTSDADKPISTATQTALDDKADSSDVPTELDDLSDVKIIGAPSAGDSLVYGSGFFQLGQAGATTLGALDDVNTVGAAFGSLLAFNGTSWDISAADLPTDDIYFHQRYVTESEALRSGATASVELYFACTAQGNGLAEDAESDTPTAGKVIKRKIYYSEAAFSDPDTGTWVEFTTLADDITFANAKAALLEYLKARTGGTVPISLKQTWEEVTAAPAFTGLLNETYGSGAAAAYSTRRLNGLYSGDCMTIRRASDSTMQSIGFVGEEIDESAIETFCSGTSCTVQIWRDQSGNGNDAEQTDPTKQPTIYTGGAIVKDGGRVAFTSTSSTSFSFTQITDVNSVFSVLRPTDFTGDSTSFILGDGSNYDYHSGDYRNLGGWLNTQYSDTVVKNGDNYLNGTSVNLITLARSAGQYVLSMIHTANTAVASQISQDRTMGARSWVGNRQELIIYSDDRTNNRTNIEENIGDYFTQNTPLLDTYSGAAAAYSLRRLSSTYTGDAVEVYNGSSYANVGFNIFGELDTVALAAHCGSNSGYVSKWYCQSGNGNDATQTATGSMPKIYDGSTGVVTENGKPIIYGNQGALNISYDLNTGNRTIVTVRAFDNQSGHVLIGTNGGIPDFLLASNANDSDTNLNSNVTVNSIHKNSASYTLPSNKGQLHTDLNSQSILYIDASFTFSETNTCLAYRNAIFTYDMHSMQELIIYPNAVTPNQTGIETNINTFYNIY